MDDINTFNLLREGDDEGGDGHEGAGEGEPDARVG